MSVTSTDKSVIVRAQLAKGKTVKNCVLAAVCLSVEQLRFNQRRRIEDRNRDMLMSSTQKSPSKDHSRSVQTLEQLMGPMPRSKKIFSAFAFILTMPGEELARSVETSDFESYPAPDRAYLTTQIQEGGGTIVDEIDDYFDEGEGERRLDRLKKSFAEVIVISNRPSRTKKFLMALALGLTVVGFAWVRDCCRTNTIQNKEKYRMSNGWSLDLGYHSAVSTIPPDKPGLFHGYTFLILGSYDRKLVDWDKIIRMASGAVVHIGSINKGKVNNLESYFALPTSQRHAYSKGLGGIHVKAESRRIDFVLVEKSQTPERSHHPDPYSSMTAGLQQREALLKQQLQFLEMHETQLAKHIRGPVVTTEWAIQCLISQRVLEADRHPIYTMA
ncbi:BRCT domain-containing protein [Polychytrium aggregatum]|uniref:BRCT domain-containing protein n=1 Tax=Polychytrium aggregatum TaxID=110093 RepID=UPI0022FF2414|nr:BRCT domain-containing protein [Polychytrium aggregatum]KAI9204294.1 BRCT domain-containing protein [Polychytrium aggregatum]